MGNSRGHIPPMHTVQAAIQKFAVLVVVLIVVAAAAAAVEVASAVELAAVVLAEVHVVQAPVAVGLAAVGLVVEELGSGLIANLAVGPVEGMADFARP